MYRFRLEAYVAGSGFVTVYCPGTILRRRASEEGSSRAYRTVRTLASEGLSGWRAALREAQSRVQEKRERKEPNSLQVEHWWVAECKLERVIQFAELLARVARRTVGAWAAMSWY